MKPYTIFGIPTRCDPYLEGEQIVFSTQAFHKHLNFKPESLGASVMNLNQTQPYPGHSLAGLGQDQAVYSPKESAPHVSVHDNVQEAIKQALINIDNLESIRGRVIGSNPSQSPGPCGPPVSSLRDGSELLLRLQLQIAGEIRQISDAL